MSCWQPEYNFDNISTTVRKYQLMQRARAFIIMQWFYKMDL